MQIPVLTSYKPHAMSAVTGDCALCRTVPATQHDHCHTHGWLRGQLCRRCNLALGRIDNGKPTRTILSDGQVSEYRERCPDCVSVPVIRDFPPRSKFAGITITTDAHRSLRALTAIASGAIERRVTMSDTMRAAVAVARQYPEELRAALSAAEEGQDR